MTFKKENKENLILDDLEVRNQNWDKLNEFKESTTEQLAQTTLKKVDKNGSGQVTWANIAQDARENISGGSVAVVGVNSVLEENLTDGSVTLNKLGDDVAKIYDSYFPSYINSVGYYDDLIEPNLWKSKNSDSDIVLTGVSSDKPLVFDGTGYGVLSKTFDNLSVNVQLTPTLFNTTHRIISIGDFELAIQNTGTLVVSGVPTEVIIELNREYILGFSFNKTTKECKVFVDGVLVFTRILPTTPLELNTDFTLGARRGAFSNNFIGTINKLSIVNGVLSDKEMIDEQLAMKEYGYISINKDGVTKPIAAENILYQSNPLSTFLNQINNNNNNLSESQKFMHISVDDVLSIFYDLTNNADTYTSIFENDKLSIFKQLHDQYGAVFSFYVWFNESRIESGTWNLENATDVFKDEFTENASWLKFGFHMQGANLETTTATQAKTRYDNVMNELFRILGSWECFDTVPRLQNYAGNLESIKAIKNTNAGITGLLTAEDTRMNYHLTQEQNDYLLTHDRLYDGDVGIHLFKTDFRIEGIADINAQFALMESDISYVNRMNDLIVYTHAYELDDPIVLSKIEACCAYAYEHGYSFDYPMHRI